jgi:hypothetical protein
MTSILGRRRRQLRRRRLTIHATYRTSRTPGPDRAALLISKRAD